MSETKEVVRIVTKIYLLAALMMLPTAKGIEYAAQGNSLLAAAFLASGLVGGNRRKPQRQKGASPMTTLADLTPEERANCRGMWCDTPKGTFVLLAPMFPDCEAFGWELLIPSKSMKIDYQLENITPRYDLPRAWTPDGTPPAGKWEYIPEVQNLCGKWDPIDNATTNEVAAEAWMGMDELRCEYGRIRKRFIGEWEEA